MASNNKKAKKKQAAGNPAACLYNNPENVMRDPKFS